MFLYRTPVEQCIINGKLINPFMTMFQPSNQNASRENRKAQLELGLSKTAARRMVNDAVDLAVNGDVESARLLYLLKLRTLYA